MSCKLKLETGIFKYLFITSHERHVQGGEKREKELENKIEDMKGWREYSFSFYFQTSKLRLFTIDIVQSPF